MEAFTLINALHPDHPGLSQEEFINVLVAVAADKWVQVTDELTGKECYSHTDTGEVSWEDPGISCVPMFLAESGVRSQQLDRAACLWFDLSVLPLACVRAPVYH